MNVSPVPSALLAIALLFAASANAEQIYGLGFPSNEGTFNVIEGKPYLLRQGERGSPGNAVDIKTNGKLMHYMSQKPLAYPLDGENPVIRLGKEDGVSDVWDLSAFPSGGSRTGAPVKAAAGKFKGWYLDWTDDEIELVTGGNTFHARRLILVKEPKSIRKFLKYPVAK